MTVIVPWPITLKAVLPGIIPCMVRAHGPKSYPRSPDVDPTWTQVSLYSTSWYGATIALTSAWVSGGG